MKHQFPSYYTIWHKLGYYALKSSAISVLFFLILPIIVIIPLSFNIEPYFSFTKGMVTLDPAAYSLRWYREILANENWILAIENSFFIGVFATIIATSLGTLAAVGLASERMPFKRYIMALLLSPMIVPLIIIAAGMFFFYTKFDLAGTYLG
ncbi:MAG: ABC transporter permease, partial [SAR324 cluster bacterium]|nr:ABC transporter permease [SAR324 cluster bacterium]